MRTSRRASVERIVARLPFRPLVSLAVTAALGVVALAALSAAAPAAPATPAADSDPWKAAAAKLSIPVYRPTVTLGLRVAWVNPIAADPGCVNDGREQLRAVYHGRKAGRYIEVFEGRPRYCTDEPPNAPVVRRLEIGGRPATLYDLCERRDCRGTAGAYTLEWCARGTTITVLALDFRPADILRFGRSMRPVDGARARQCARPT